MKKRLRVLVVDDEPDVGELAALALEPAFECRGVSTGEKALEALWKFAPDAMILDAHLPGFQGAALLKLIRADEKVSGLPVLVLTGDGSEKTLLAMFEAGADDLLTKPFSPLELVARVRALLRRRARQPEADILAGGPLRLTVSTHRVEADGRAVEVTPTEFAILRFLLEQPGKVVSKQRLVEFLWGREDEVGPRTIDTHLANLRKKLGKSSRCLETVRDVGIRLAC